MSIVLLNFDQFLQKCYFEQPIHFSCRYTFNIFSLIYLKQKLLRQTYSFFHAWRLHCVYFLGIPFRRKLIRIHGTHFIPPNFNPNFLKKIKTQIQLNILMNVQFASALDIIYYTFKYLSWRNEYFSNCTHQHTLNENVQYTNSNALWHLKMFSY